MKLALFLTDFYIFSNCTGTTDEEIMIINSPNYPNDYPTETTCMWQLQVPMGRFIKLHFEDFETERYHDVLSIYDVVEENLVSDETLLETLSGEDTPDHIELHENKIRLLFVTDSGVTKKGFRIRYEGTRINYISM